MSEVKRKALRFELEGKTYICFDEDHSFADVLRQMISEGASKSELIFLIETMED